MTETISSEDLFKIIEHITFTIEENKDYLTELDQAIGDGDHGINLSRGFLEVRQKLGEFSIDDAGALLKSVSSVLIATVGGAVGPLYGMAFMKAGDVGAGKQELDVNDLAKMLEAAEQAIINIGKAQLGEKTMLDAIHPATEAMKQSADNNEPLIEACQKCVSAAEEGVKSTIEMVSKRGRSSYLGERTRGHQDVGATSFYLILKSALETLKELKNSY